ncbi:hypothetical protein HN587_07540 [Candidatus Woesearchaeota archaeon]|jgi:Icc-related predicted phosphoesterase|nr:hypothetical protein [Candidatus Woesearchaeota archaeon]
MINPPIKTQTTQKKLLKRLIIGIFLTLILFILLGCEQKQILKIDDMIFEIKEDQVIQTNIDSDQTASFGVISDPHGKSENVAAFSRIFLQKKVDGIILLGDYANNKATIDPNHLFDFDDIYFCIKAAAQTNLPIYVIPGNHEYKKDYFQALEKLNNEHPNVFDMTKIRFIHGEDFNFISNPYGSDFTYVLGHFEGDIKSFEEYINLLNNTNPVILLSHQPPRCNNKEGIDRTNKEINVGDNTINILMRNNNIKFSLSGHIHEAGRKGVDSQCQLIPENTFSTTMLFNPGTATEWTYNNNETLSASAAIITINGSQMSYELFKIE